MFLDGGSSVRFALSKLAAGVMDELKSLPEGLPMALPGSVLLPRLGAGLDEHVVSQDPPLGEGSCCLEHAQPDTGDKRASEHGEVAPLGDRACARVGGADAHGESVVVPGSLHEGG
eukprot:1283479-Alexandrium_andersonii.AAC.1